MRILMTTDPIGGVWTYAADLARELVRNGHELVLASMGGPVTQDQRAALPTGGLHLEVGEFRLEWMDEPWTDVDRAADWLLRLETSWQPDVVHLNGYVHGATPFHAPRIVVAHSCVVSWWRAVRGGEPPARYDEYRRRVRTGLAEAAVVVAPTRFMLSELRTHYGPLNTTRVISNGRSRGILRPRRKFPLVASAGRVWDRAKNIETLLAAAAAFPWPLLIAGDTAPPAAPERNQEELDASGDVRFVGRLDERGVAELLGAAAVFAHPARYEPFGLAVLEAAIAGCALVLSDIPSLRESWEDAAIFVDANDAAAIGDAVRRLACRSGERRRLAGLARTRAGEFSSQRMAEAYASLYEHVAAARRA